MKIEKHGISGGGSSGGITMADHDAHQHTNLTNKLCYAGPTSPTADNDIVDTAGLGQSFTLGDRWINTSLNIEYFCLVATAGNAVWRESSFMWFAGTDDDMADGDEILITHNAISVGRYILNVEEMIPGETGVNLPVNTISDSPRSIVLDLAAGDRTAIFKTGASVVISNAVNPANNTTFTVSADSTFVLGYTRILVTEATVYEQNTPALANGGTGSVWKVMSVGHIIDKTTITNKALYPFVVERLGDTQIRVIRVRGTAESGRDASAFVRIAIGIQ